MKALSVQNLSLVQDAPEERCFNFDILSGEVAFVLGENGSGKSLLLSCLCGRRHSPGASISVCGHELFSRASRPVAKSLIGVVFQHPGLLRTLSVRDNVALPFLQSSLALSSELEQFIGVRLALVGCGHLRESDSGHLSSGDQRCIALARALSGSTRVLLADEPTAGLSPDAKLRIEELIGVLVAKGAIDAAVVCTQDVEFALRIGTRFIFLQDPQLEAGLLGGVREERLSADVLSEPYPREISAFLSRRRKWHKVAV